MLQALLPRFSLETSRSVVANSDSGLLALSDIAFHESEVCEAKHLRFNAA